MFTSVEADRTEEVLGLSKSLFGNKGTSDYAFNVTLAFLSKFKTTDVEYIRGGLGKYLDMTGEDLLESMDRGFIRITQVREILNNLTSLINFTHKFSGGAPELFLNKKLDTWQVLVDGDVYESTTSITEAHQLYIGYLLVFATENTSIEEYITEFTG